MAGKIGKGQIVLDSSSGNAGIAYAMLGAMMKLPVQIVVPGNASKERKMRIQAHGATLIQTDPMEGYDEALREGHRIAERSPLATFIAINMRTITTGCRITTTRRQRFSRRPKESSRTLSPALERGEQLPALAAG